MVGAFLTLVLIGAFLVGMVVPEVVACIRLLLARVPGVLNYLVDLLASVDVLPETVESFLNDINWKETVTKLLNLLYQGVGGTFNLAAGMLTSVVSGAMNLLIGFIFSIYLLMGKDRLKNQLDRLMGQYNPSALESSDPLSVFCSGRLLPPVYCRPVHRSGDSGCAVYIGDAPVPVSICDDDWGGDRIFGTDPGGGALISAVRSGFC